MEVSCNLTVDGHTLPMWGAVTDYRNQAIQNPDSDSINTARMRCLVKAMAMFGLGHYIYAGESFPEDIDKTDLNDDQKEHLINLRALKTAQIKSNQGVV